MKKRFSFRQRKKSIFEVTMVANESSVADQKLLEINNSHVQIPSFHTSNVSVEFH